MEHEAVAEAAVVPSPDPLRLAVPKAFVKLAPGHLPTRDTALAILRQTREQLAPYKRIRRLEFSSELPKTISRKIRRIELRDQEDERLSGASVPRCARPTSSTKPTSPSSSADRRAAGGALALARVRPPAYASRLVARRARGS
jgi:hypothetical protein